MTISITDAVELTDSLYIVPSKSIMNASDLAIYELKDGEARLLENYDGIPSDSNFLNQQMAETNYLFDQLLDIEEQIQEAYIWRITITSCSHMTLIRQITLTS